MSRGRNAGGSRPLVASRRELGPVTSPWTTSAGNLATTGRQHVFILKFPLTHCDNLNVALTVCNSLLDGRKYVGYRTCISDLFYLRSLCYLLKLFCLPSGNQQYQQSSCFIKLFKHAILPTQMLASFQPCGKELLDLKPHLRAPVLQPLPSRGPPPR